MTIHTRSFIMLLAGAPLLVSQAQTAATAPPPQPLSPTEQTINEIKNPVSWFNWGADFRARNEYFDNILTLTPSNPLHEQDYFRFRARLWGSITPVENLSLNARLATEPREWMRPAGYTPFRGQSGWDWTEGTIDNLNVQWRKILDQPANLIVGRQDILLGDGWLTGDGTPFDGSWTYFMDAARFTYDLPAQHTTIEAIGIIQDGKDDGWLQTINDQDRYLTEQNEKGAILSIANSSIKGLTLNPYFFYKHDAKLNPFDPVNNPAPRGGDNADIYTLGGRATGFYGNHWKYSVEGAYQFGEKQDSTVRYPSVISGYRDINAFGANTKLTYMLRDKLNNQFSLSYEFLSGDNPNTQDDEMFDVLWGRWPRWSEMGLYNFAAETRIGNEANMQRVGPTWSIDPIKNLNFSASYLAWLAIEDVPTRGVPGPFTNTGNFRGHFFQGVLKYKFSKHLSGHLWSEFMLPGHYYTSTTLMSFLRAEVMLTF
jgi:hypothetical protein